MVVVSTGNSHGSLAFILILVALGLATSRLLALTDMFHLCYLVTYPLDLTKTRLQIQGEGGSYCVPHRGMIRTAAGIGKNII